MTKSTAKPRSDYPDFGVRYETISRYFEPPLARSTFHDKVQDGTIIPMKGGGGFYLLNESLRCLGLREVRELPAQSDAVPSKEIIAACVAGVSEKTAATGARGRMVLMRCFVFMVVLFCFILLLLGICFALMNLLLRWELGGAVDGIGEG